MYQRAVSPSMKNASAPIGGLFKQPYWVGIESEMFRFFLSE
jgi:hypothetical protein